MSNAAFSFSRCPASVHVSFLTLSRLAPSTPDSPRRVVVNINVASVFVSMSREAPTFIELLSGGRHEVRE